MDTIDPTFERFVEQELGDVAVVSGGKYVSPKIQNYYKTWTAAKELTVASLKDKPLSALQVLSITTAYEQGVGKGHQAFNTNKEIENPYVPDSTHRVAWDYGYTEGKEQAERSKQNGN